MSAERNFQALNSHDDDVELRDPLSHSRASAAAADVEAQPVYDRNDPIEKGKRRKILIRAVLGELVCTTIFLFTVMAAGLNYGTGGPVAAATGSLMGAIVTGFCAVAIIYAFADVSGAHFNPAVTFATLVTQKTSPFKSGLYWAAQILASIIASALLVALFPYENAAAHVVVTVPDGVNLIQALLMEFILTFILVYVIFATAFETVDSNNVKVVTDKDDTKGTGAKNLTIYTTTGNTKAGFAPLAIGLTLGFLCLLGGSVSGGAFNPARTLGPAIVSWTWTDQWVYWLGDFLGAAVAGLIQQFFAHAAVMQ
ncbi:hypothetical protein CAOG_002866 [Capsaspora owczarzaki ATCC 30864]|uniref:Aquaporin n=2 Tax=Capsaspora owczarzaki (strain ATCC 30864) TaxID=595528 RepID=A0A0D2VNB1_CAPO3|nr:hypothetical protein CAOG_002866 [Capsaspora owczarzaki ATCC 30864]